jgi:hypothetical protein
MSNCGMKEQFMTLRWKILAKSYGMMIKCPHCFPGAFSTKLACRGPRLYREENDKGILGNWKHRHVRLKESIGTPSIIEPSISSTDKRNKPDETFPGTKD